MGSLPLSERAVRTAWRVAPKRAFTGAISWFGGAGIPTSARQAVLARFARLYGIDTAEAARTLDEYGSLDEFFTRQLHPSLRPVDATADVVVSPADGTVVESGVAVEGQLIQAKGVLFDLEELLSDAPAAARLSGGHYVITYLSPKDYHRVHAPIGGEIVGWRYVPGTLFPVNAGSVRREPGLFIRNERFVTLIEGDAGLCAVVMVAAVGVGHVTAAYDPEVGTHHRSFLRAGTRQRDFAVRPRIAKGAELATFHLGSTTVVVFEPGRVELVPLAPGSKTKMGQAIGRSLPAGVRHAVSTD
jgi:phosphatidylserine decarboxylase